MFPLGDDHPTERRPIVTYTIIGLNVAAFLVSLTPRDPDSVIRWTMVPADLHWPTLFTSLFLHGGWLHLLGNMWMLWVFGDNVEDRLGRVGYAVFYLVCGLAADAAHIATDPRSGIPTLGASGAIAGVLGAYVCFYPRQRIRTLVFLFLFVTIIQVPAFLWIGIWFVENLVMGAQLATRGLSGGVAYTAHLGGFVAGAAIAGSLRLLADRWRPAGRRIDSADRGPSGRRFFTPIPDDPGIEFLEDEGDGYSVLRLSEDDSDVGRIGQVVSGLTGEAASDVAARIAATRGMIVRTVPRETAGRIQRELHVLGIPSAKVLHNRANLPPSPVPVEGGSWDDRAIRLRAGDQIVMVPWTSPFLLVGARIDGQPLIDLFVTRTTAFRILGARHVPLTVVDPTSRTEVSSDLAGFAAAALDRGAGARNDGVRAAAGLMGWGRLDFVNAADYDDYVFWLYTLTLAKGPAA